MKQMIAFDADAVIQQELNHFGEELMFRLQDICNKHKRCQFVVDIDVKLRHPGFSQNYHRAVWAAEDKK